jgi:hypothetical protein
VSRSRAIALCALVLLAAPVARAQSDDPEPDPVPARPDLPPATPNGFQAKADKAEVRLGEPFSYAVQVRHDLKETYELKGKPKLDPFEVENASCKRSSGGDEAVTTCTMTLKLMELDDHEVPELELIAHTEDGDKLLKVPGAKVKGVGIIDPSARTEDLTLRDIAPPEPLLVRTWKWVLIGLGVLGAIALGLLLWWLWRRRPQRVLKTTPVVALTLDERALKRLRELQAEDLPAQGRRKEFYFRLSEIMREYLGSRYGFNALDLTTEELRGALRRRPTPGLDHGTLARWCDESDMVKFAKHEPDDSSCANAINFCYDLVERTRARTAPNAAA